MDLYLFCHMALLSTRKQACSISLKLAGLMEMAAKAPVWNEVMQNRRKKKKTQKYKMNVCIKQRIEKYGKIVGMNVWNTET